MSEMNCGTINAKQKKEQSRRDDLESLGYVLIYFCRGSLPWQGIKAENNEEKNEMILESKMSTPIDELCHNYPEEFATYLKYTRSLQFSDKPDYTYLHKLFANLFKKLGYTYDFVFDWTPREPVSIANHPQI